MTSLVVYVFGRYGMLIGIVLFSGGFWPLKKGWGWWFVVAGLIFGVLGILLRHRYRKMRYERRRQRLAQQGGG